MYSVSEKYCLICGARFTRGLRANYEHIYTQLIIMCSSVMHTIMNMGYINILNEWRGRLNEYVWAIVRAEGGASYFVTREHINNPCCTGRFMVGATKLLTTLWQSNYQGKGLFCCRTTAVFGCWWLSEVSSPNEACRFLQYNQVLTIQYSAAVMS